ncbi:uncharacterized protein LOC123539168 [Mercenaria mercenaria]|uniref:uncharacterized protein LOC123539168 n=1 Tax=Mercenaria mercenaria TaxID=6596 RepID=UPI00234EA210|nr:uncharacterized protein LOC123539168 [Mercenaria mercenaria]
MALQKILYIVRYVFIFSTSFTIVKSAVAHRLRNMNENGKDLTSKDTDMFITLKSADSMDVHTINHNIHAVPVHHFARHRLCRHEEGRKYFYRAINSKLCEITGMFAANLVEHLCRLRGSFLDKWVSELFDMDGDGMVTHFEKRYYDELNT